MGYVEPHEPVSGGRPFLERYPNDVEGQDGRFVDDEGEKLRKVAGLSEVERRERVGFQFQVPRERGAGGDRGSVERVEGEADVRSFVSREPSQIIVDAHLDEGRVDRAAGRQIEPTSRRSDLDLALDDVDRARGGHAEFRPADADGRLA